MVQWSNVFTCKSRKVFIYLFRWQSYTQDLTNICLVEFFLKLASSSSFFMFLRSTQSLEEDLFHSSWWVFPVSVFQCCYCVGNNQERSWWIGTTMEMVSQIGSRDGFCGDCNCYYIIPRYIISINININNVKASLYLISMNFVLKNMVSFYRFFCLTHLWQASHILLRNFLY